MAKRIKYQLGDIILVQVSHTEGRLPARILKQDGGSALIEVYFTELIFGHRFDTSLIFALKPQLTMWCHDNAIRRGEWPIIVNEPVTQDEEIYFWTRDLSLGFCLIKGTDKVNGEPTGILISEEETKNYNPYGITNEHALPKKLAKMLADYFN